MVTIRLSRFGRKKVPLYRIVVVDHRKKRDGSYLEEVGQVNPKNKKAAVIKRERIKYWVSKGARLSATVAQLVGKNA